ncbi:hypothetical protein C8Q79DRAFT_695336 [Trametes meyenii]|nr:hypothetical protein C8Q79DRAFT_695336 [Trametes meyenii]
MGDKGYKAETLAAAARLGMSPAAVNSFEVFEEMARRYITITLPWARDSAADDTRDGPMARLYKKRVGLFGGLRNTVAKLEEHLERRGTLVHDPAAAERYPLNASRAPRRSPLFTFKTGPSKDEIVSEAGEEAFEDDGDASAEVDTEESAESDAGYETEEDMEPLQASSRESSLSPVPNSAGTPDSASNPETQIRSPGRSARSPCAAMNGTTDEHHCDDRLASGSDSDRRTPATDIDNDYDDNSADSAGNKANTADTEDVLPLGTEFVVPRVPPPHSSTPTSFFSAGASAEFHRAIDAHTGPSAETQISQKLRDETPTSTVTTLGSRRASLAQAPAESAWGGMPHLYSGERSVAPTEYSTDVEFLYDGPRHFDEGLEADHRFPTPLGQRQLATNAVEEPQTLSFNLRDVQDSSEVLSREVLLNIVQQALSMFRGM